MNIKMDTRLKKLRQSSGMTQEQLADLLDVTPQAISRWENGSSMPDVVHLVALANCFEVTLDELLGRDELRNSMKLSELYDEVKRLRREGKERDAERMLREALQVYPNNQRIRMELVLTITRLEDAAEHELNEAIEMSMQIEDSTRNRKYLARTAANLVSLYMRTGQTAKARKFAGTLPHLWQSRQLLIPDTAPEEKYEEELKNAVRIALTVLCAKIKGADERKPGTSDDLNAFAMEFTERYPDDEMLEIIGSYLKR
ncbi:MAG: helix-turn-helix transcriptional regulator [Clostridia bacterium]|nr:helix-turn-helix transcriptional regulator [Clostridia bacterium]MBQ8370623.1 helix-turn-helix transcriptional regulator [Clostridia bacterium]MBQ8512840.1 helix-turn-helix transcriptional regulator [Clostridia bacterium]